MWTVETLNAAVDAEIQALPKDLRARLSQISTLIEAVGFENIPANYVKHLDGKLWELRLKAKSGIARAIYVTVTGKRVVIVKAFVKKTQKTPIDADQGVRHSPRKSEGAGMTKISKLHQEWMRDEEYRREYEALEEEFALARAIIEARSKAGLTQEELAERMETSQSTIARLESGKAMPSGKTLSKLAKATGTKLEIRFT